MPMKVATSQFSTRTGKTRPSTEVDDERDMLQPSATGGASLPVPDFDMDKEEDDKAARDARRVTSEAKLRRLKKDEASEEITPTPEKVENVKFEALKPLGVVQARDKFRAPEHPVQRASFTMTEDEKMWLRLHGVVRVELETQNIREADLYKLIGKMLSLGPDSKLGGVLCTQNMGIKIETNTKGPWELNAGVVPYYIAAALALTSNVVKKPVLYDGLYKGYIKRVNKALELMEETNGSIEDEMRNTMLVHTTNTTPAFLATYYQVFRRKDDDVKGASKHIKTWMGKLFFVWDNQIKLAWEMVDARRSLAILDLNGQTANGIDGEDFDDE